MMCSQKYHIDAPNGWKNNLYSYMDYNEPLSLGIINLTNINIH